MMLSFKKVRKVLMMVEGTQSFNDGGALNPVTLISTRINYSLTGVTANKDGLAAIDGSSHSICLVIP